MVSSNQGKKEKIGIEIATSVLIMFFSVVSCSKKTEAPLPSAQVQAVVPEGLQRAQGPESPNQEEADHSSPPTLAFAVVPTGITWDQPFSVQVTVSDPSGRPAVKYDKPVSLAVAPAKAGVTNAGLVEEYFKEMLMKGSVSDEVKSALLEMDTLSGEVKEVIRKLAPGVPAVDLAQQTKLTPEMVAKLEPIFFPKIAQNMEAQTLGTEKPTNGVVEFKNLKLSSKTLKVSNLQLIVSVPGATSVTTPIALPPVEEAVQKTITFVINGTVRQGIQTAPNTYQIGSDTYVVKVLSKDFVQFNGKNFRVKEHKSDKIVIDLVK
jgi:hypothetical protein